METVRTVRMKLHLETDRRTLVRGFENLNDLRLFMQEFFSLPHVADRRAGASNFPYSGAERRMQMEVIELRLPTHLERKRCSYRVNDLFGSI